jgi:hypothetical protein
MITKNLDKYKVSTTEQTITSYAGLPLLMGMAGSLGLEKKLNGLKLKERERGYKPAEMIWTLMGLLQAGGVALEDVSLLKGDEGLRELLGELPAANTLGEFLRRFGNRALYELGEIELATAVKVIRALGMKRVTLDVDAFFLESQKEGVLQNYEGDWGYNPVAVSCGELKMPMAGLFREGNASPMANLGGLLKRVMKALSDYGIEVRIRSDSAGYQAGVVRECHQAGADFTITARKDPAVMETIRSIPKGAWQTLESGAWENRRTEIAETVHAFGTEDLPAYRLIVIRWVKEQKDLFDQDPYEYHAVFNSLDEWAAGVVMQFHRARQDESENVNKELSGGFGLSKLPCKELKANAAYFQIALLANIVFCALKHMALPEGWRRWTMKTVRFRLIRLAGLVVRKARYLWLKISDRYPYRGVFEEVRGRLLGLWVELARL